MAGISRYNIGLFQTVIHYDDDPVLVLGTILDGLGVKGVVFDGFGF